MESMISSERSTGSLRRSVIVLALSLALVAFVSGSVDAQTTSNNIGGGEAHGSVSFDSPGVPQLFAPCRAVDFDLDGGSEATLVLNVTTSGGGGAVEGYAGEVELNGSGHGFCEGASSGSGTLAITIPKATAANGSTIECESLQGGYVRVGPDVEAVLGGECAVNANPIPVMVVFRGEFVPTGGSGLSQPGLSEPIMNADFDGAFVIMPA